MQYLISTLQQIRSCQRGNVAVIFALASIPILIAIGAGMDYAQAARRRDQLNAIADAAALSAVTPSMMAQSSFIAQAAAVSMFNGQASALGGITLLPGSPTIQVNDISSATGTTRTSIVNYQATSVNNFPKVLGQANILIRGQSSSQAETQPNINFYLMLDTSPSMAIAATTDGITTMVNNTPNQKGCAFACHQSNPAADNLGNPNGEDNYALARNLNVTLRIDLVQQAVQNMMSTAQQTENSTKAVYGMSIYDFDYTTHKISDMTTSLTLAQQQASNIQLLEVYSNSNLTSNNNNNDQDTNWDGAIGSMNSAMSAPGNGTNNLGDSPQEVLFIVTDGVVDESLNGNRTMKAMGGDTCTTIKNRGIRIAVLYTTYNPLPTNPFYNQNIASFQPKIGNALQSCASPGLYFQVNTGGDISTAMSTLFQSAVNVAHLTK